MPRPKKSKICLLFAGGTIGMVKDPKTGALKPAKNIDTILKMLPEIQDSIEVEVEYLFNIDSSNMLPKHWTHIARSIERLYDKYDGFVVTQGTDTMIYTASALSFALENLGKPVVLTGSMVPSSEIASDARSNLTSALLVATLDYGEVIITFGSKIMRGNRCTKYMESFTNAFHSPNFPLIGEIYRPIRMFDWRIKRSKRKKIKIQPAFKSDIAVVKIFPGYDTSFLQERIDKNNMSGLILEAFGPGNIPFHNVAFMDCLRKAQQQKIPVVICSQMEHGTVDLSAYECGMEAKKLGVISAGDMTTAAATVKLMWCLARYKNFDLICRMMEKNLAGEKMENE